MHSIALFVTNLEEASKKLLLRIEGSKNIDLPRGFVGTVLFDKNGVSVRATDLSEKELAYQGTSCLSRRADSIAREVSKIGCVAYIETEYWGGDGTQVSLVYRDGDLVFGPNSDESGQSENRPINRALRIIGFKAESGHDEFESIGFCRVRGNDDFF